MAIAHNEDKDIILYRIKVILSDSFTTVNSGNGNYDVNIKVSSLKEAQELHRSLLDLVWD